MDQDSSKIETNNTEQKPAQTDPDSPKTSNNDHGVKKKRIMVFGGLLLATAAVAAYVLTSGSTTTETPETPVVTSQQSANQVVELAAALSLVEGAVQYSSDGQAWTDASGGETVQKGQYVRTLGDGRTVMLLDDGSAVRLDNDTTVMLTVSDSSLVEVSLIAGQVYSRVVEDGSRSFAVVTETERFEAQGTAYKTATGDVDEVEVYQSSVKVDSDDTIVEEGNKYNTDSKEKLSIDLDELSEDDFVQWNKDRDSESDDFKDKLGVLKDDEDEEDGASSESNSGTGQNTESSNPGDKIQLSASSTDDGVRLSWTYTGVNRVIDGFKIVRDQFDTTPSYGEHKSVYVHSGESSGQSKSYSKEIELTDGKKYNFRVCIYFSDGGSCSIYSNSVSATAPFEELEEVEDGVVELEIDGDELEWEFTGTAPHGFKVVMSEDTESPSYPANSIQYVGAESTSTELPEKPAGTYFVRVCKYTASSEIDGGCTDYSNTVEYIVE